MGKNKNSHYDNKVVLKPWGNEYVIYRNSNKLSVTFLNINYKKSTSLHCHPKKKNWFYNTIRKSFNTVGFMGR